MLWFGWAPPMMVAYPVDISSSEVTLVAYIEREQESNDSPSLHLLIASAIQSVI
jgi:hypothetical protein